jgi:hypothetical protein
MGVVGAVVAGLQVAAPYNTCWVNDNGPANIPVGPGNFGQAGFTLITAGGYSFATPQAYYSSLYCSQRLVSCGPRGRAHGIGLSIGTDVPIDLCYLDRVAELVDRLKTPCGTRHREKRTAHAVMATGE